MLKSFIRVSFRNLTKHKISSVISSGSLALGILFAFVIFKFTAFERSFDLEIPDYNDKVRMNFKIVNNGSETVHSATAPYPFTNLFVPKTAEIESYTRFFDAGEGILSYNDRVNLKTEGITFADQSLLDFFGVELIQGGNIEDNDLRSVVISASLAKQIFGQESPLNKQVTYLGVHDFIVKGVFADLPANSSIRFDFVGAMDFLQILRPDYYLEGENWGGYSFHTFYQLAAGSARDEVQAKLNQHYSDRYEITAENPQSEIFEFELVPVTDIHLNSGVTREQNASGSESRIRMLEYLSFIILAIAWFNFINLQSTKAAQRMKEIGVRRVFGAGNKNLYVLFFLEFGLLNILSFGVALLALWGLNPYLSGLTTVNLNATILPLDAHPLILPFLLTGFLVSSIYPAILTVKTGVNLKRTQSGKSNFLRRALVTAQFAVSLFMIAYTYTVYSQVDYMSNQNPGFDTSKVMMVRGPLTQLDSHRQSAEFVKEQALNLKGVALATWGGASPGVNQGWQGNIREMDTPNPLYQTVYFSNITNDYFEVFDIQVIAGRVPRQNSPHEETRVVVNEEALEGWGWKSAEDAIGKRIGYGSGSTVVGVVENFNSLGFQSDIDPGVFIVDHLYKAETANDYFLLKIDPRQTGEILSSIQNAYENYFPGNPFIHSFLDEEFQHLYASEVAYNKVFSIFSGLAIILACIGMLGMVRYSAINRKREIGIRKVLGSGEFNIVRLFLNEYFWLVLLAFVVAAPVSYYLIDAWLGAFAYRIDITLQLFLLPLIVLLTLVMVTVGSISYKASLANPVKVLKEL